MRRGRPLAVTTPASLYLGPIYVIFDAAADEIAGASRQRVTEWEVMFASSGKIGPFRTETMRYPAVCMSGVAELTLVDEGRDMRLVASGTAAFRPI